MRAICCAVELRAGAQITLNALSAAARRERNRLRCVDARARTTARDLREEDAQRRMVKVVWRRIVEISRLFYGQKITYNAQHVFVLRY